MRVHCEERVDSEGSLSSPPPSNSSLSDPHACAALSSDISRSSSISSDLTFASSTSSFKRGGSSSNEEGSVHSSSERRPKERLQGGGGAEEERVTIYTPYVMHSPQPSPPILEHSITDTTPLLQPYDYIMKNPGKNVRGMLLDAINETWLHVSPSQLAQVKLIIDALHNSSLLVDDIEDHSKLRRGAPAAHLVYGIPSTLNCANYVYMMALHQTLTLKSHRATVVFTEEMLALHRGQGHEIYWRDHLHCPSEKEYERMVLDKTGGLFRMAVKLLIALSERSESVFMNLVNSMSLYFQIRDDYVNLASEEYMKKKDFCEDLTEGKFSFPIIHCIRNDKLFKSPHEVKQQIQEGDDDDNFNDNSVIDEEKGSGDEGRKKKKKKKKRGEKEPFMLSVLRLRTEDESIKRQAVAHLHARGSLLYTRQRLEELFEQIRKEMTELGGNPTLWGLCERLHETVTRCGEQS